MESISAEEDSPGNKIKKYKFRKRKNMISMSGSSSESAKRKFKGKKKIKDISPEADSTETLKKKRKRNLQKNVVQGKISKYFKKKSSKMLGHKSSGSKFKDLIFSTISKRRKKDSDNEKLNSLTRRLFNSENFPETKKLIDEIDIQNILGHQLQVCGFTRNQDIDQTVNDGKYLDYFAINVKVQKVDDNLPNKKQHSSDDWLSIRTRGSPKVLYNLMNHLSHAQMKDIVDIGFGSLISMATEEIPGKISHFVVDNLDTDTMELKLSNGVISITPDLVYKVLKVPMGGDDIESLSRLERDDVTTVEWQNQFKGCSITPKKVYGKIMESGIGGIIFKLNFLVLFTNAMGLSGKGGHCRPEKSIIGYINEHTRIENINWCKYVCSCLKQSKVGWKRDDYNSYYSGPLTALTLMYIISTKCNSISVPREYPSIKHWTTELLKKREDFELANGGFGLLDLYSFDSSDDNIFEREIEAKLDKLDQKVNFLQLVLEDLHIQFSSALSDHPDSNRLKIIKQQFNALIRNTDLSEYGFQEDFEKNSLDNAIQYQNNVIEEDLEKNSFDNDYGFNHMSGTYVGECSNSFEAEEENGKEIFDAEELTNEINQKVIEADIVLQNQNHQDVSLKVCELDSLVKNSSESEFEGKLAEGQMLVKGTDEDEIMYKDVEQEVVPVAPKSSESEFEGKLIDDEMMKESTVENEIVNEQPERQHSNQLSGIKFTKFDTPEIDENNKSNVSSFEDCLSKAIALQVDKPVNSVRRLFNQSRVSFDDMPKHLLNKPPSFSLGIEFDDSQSPPPVERNQSSYKGKTVTFASEPETNVYNKNVKPEIINSNVRVQPQREINVPWFIKSPFKVRGSKLNRKDNMLSIDESVTADTLFIIDEDAFPYDIVYSSKQTGYSILRESLESLAPGQFVTKYVIDAWADLLNFEEMYKSATSPSRYFFKTKLTDHLKIEDILMNPNTLRLFEHYINESDYHKKRMKLSDKKFDLIFFPVTTLDHFFLICFNMKNGKVVLIDNSNIEENLTTRQRYFKVPQELIRVFDQYLTRMSPGTTESIFRYSEPERYKMKWRTALNSLDNGVFLMSHMDNYFRESESKFHYGFCNESKDQDQQLKFLRFKYAARILLSENNTSKASFQKNVDKFRPLNKEIRKELVKNSAVRTPASLDECLYGS